MSKVRAGLCALPRLELTRFLPKRALPHVPDRSQLGSAEARIKAARRLSARDNLAQTRGAVRNGQDFC
jgi:hypothetical protein